MAPFPVSRMGFYEASFTKIRCHVQFKGLLSIEKKMQFVWQNSL